MQVEDNTSYALQNTTNDRIHFSEPDVVLHHSQRGINLKKASTSSCHVDGCEAKRWKYPATYLIQSPKHLSKLGRRHSFPSIEQIEQTDVPVPSTKQIEQTDVPVQIEESDPLPGTSSLSAGNEFLLQQHQYGNSSRIPQACRSTCQREDKRKTFRAFPYMQEVDPEMLPFLVEPSGEAGLDEIEDYCIENIRGTCCCFCIGIYGIYKSIQCRRAKNRCEIKLARHYGKAAKSAAFTATLVGTVFIIFYIWFGCYYYYQKVLKKEGAKYYANFYEP